MLKTEMFSVWVTEVNLRGTRRFTFDGESPFDPVNMTGEVTKQRESLV